MFIQFCLTKVAILTNYDTVVGNVELYLRNNRAKKSLKIPICDLKDEPVGDDFAAAAALG